MAYTQKNSPFRQTKDAANAVNDQQNKKEVTIPKKPVRTKKTEVPTKSRKMTLEETLFEPKTPKTPKTTETTEIQKNGNKFDRLFVEENTPKKGPADPKKEPSKKKTPPKR